MREERGSILSKIIYLIFIIIFIVIFFSMYQVYTENNFNGLSKSELNMYSSIFSRDELVKFNEKRSYKIESNTFNDAMLSKKIEVKKNTPYKVSCMVKTENIVTEKEPSCGGAHICIADTVERSNAVFRNIRLAKIRVLF